MTHPPAPDARPLPLRDLEARAAEFVAGCEGQGVVALVLVARIDDEGDHAPSPVVAVTQLGPGEIGRTTLVRVLHEYRHLEVSRGERRP